jgi:lipoic acid synthetase
VHAPDPENPMRTAKAVTERALGFCVVTRVTRDDLPDGEARHIAQTIEAICNVPKIYAEHI